MGSSKDERSVRTPPPHTPWENHKLLYVLLEILVMTNKIKTPPPPPDRIFWLTIACLLGMEYFSLNIFVFLRLLFVFTFLQHMHRKKLEAFPIQ